MRVDRLVRCAGLILAALVLAPAGALGQGALVNGGNHAGTIALPEQIDQWTFTAAQGDRIARVKSQQRGGGRASNQLEVDMRTRFSLLPFLLGAAVAACSDSPPMEPPNIEPLAVVDKDPIIGMWETDPDALMEEIERAWSEDGAEMTQEAREWIEEVVYGEGLRFQMNIAEDGTVTLSGQPTGMEEINDIGTWERIGEGDYRLTTEHVGEVSASVTDNQLSLGASEIGDAPATFRRMQFTLDTPPGVQSPARTGGEQANREETERVEAERAAAAAVQQWARRYRDATPISAAEFLQRVPAVSVRVRASPFITQRLPIEAILDLIVQRVQAAGIRVDPQAHVVLDVSLLWDAAEWTTRRGGQVLSSFPIHSRDFRMQLLVAAPVYRDGGFHRAQFAVVTRSTAGSAWGDWNRAALRNDITKNISEWITEIRRDNDRHASQEAWRGLLWTPTDEAVIHAAYQAAREEDGGRLASAMAGMSDIQPAMFTFHGDGQRILRSTAHLEQQWRSRLERLGLRANPDSRNRITHDVFAMQDPVSPVGGRLWGQLSEQFNALSSTARLWEDNVAFELNGDYVLMNVVHSSHTRVQVSMRARDLGQLAHAVQDAFLTEKFEEQMGGSRPRR